MDGSSDITNLDNFFLKQQNHGISLIISKSIQEGAPKQTWGLAKKGVALAKLYELLHSFVSGRTAH